MSEIHEECSCGATITVKGQVLPSLDVSDWRKEHQHTEPQRTAKHDASPSSPLRVGLHGILKPVFDWHLQTRTTALLRGEIVAGLIDDIVELLVELEIAKPDAERDYRQGKSDE